MPKETQLLVGVGRWKLASNNVLVTSDGRNWSGVAAEIRRHVAAEAPEVIADRTVVGVALRGNPNSVIYRRGNGFKQATRAVKGAFWLCPSDVPKDQIRITDAIPEMLHIYLPRRPFRALEGEDELPELGAATVDYDTGPLDPWLAEMARIVAAELARQTASGRLLVETAGLALAASLAHRHSSRSQVPGIRMRHALDEQRLRRVVDFVETHLDDDISVEDLAAVACLSRFYFVRAFKAATDVTPHRYVSNRRLERAKSILRLADMSLSDLALICRFSSQANFSRAFRRAVGVSPAAYRAAVR